METANQALEEKAKALATARMRYKQDAKSLSAAFDDACLRRDQIKSEAKNNTQRQQLQKYIEQLTEAQTRLEAVKQRRHALDEERREMFNQVVERKADLKLRNTGKVRRSMSSLTPYQKDNSLQQVEEQIERLKDEQKHLIKSYSQVRKTPRLHTLTQK